jgi:hypothetical protein
LYLLPHINSTCSGECWEILKRRSDKLKQDQFQAWNDPVGLNSIWDLFISENLLICVCIVYNVNRTVSVGDIFYVPFIKRGVRSVSFDLEVI